MRTLLAAVVVAATVAAGAPAARAPSWQTAPRETLHTQALAFAAGRLWFVKGLDDGTFRLISARVHGGRLTDWKTARPPVRENSSYRGRLGERLVFTAGTELVALPLLPTGQVGKPGAVGGAPPPASSGGSEVVQLRDRVVRIVGVDTAREFQSAVGVCCAVDGSTVTYTSFLKPGAGPRPLLGLDRRGRLWLAWHTMRPLRRAVAGIVELDPDTLQPRGAPSIVPGLARGFVAIHALVCAESCRLLVSGFAETGFVDLLWGPAEGATILRLPCRSPCSIDARQDGGRLALAYLGGTGEERTIVVARGDASGRNLRRISSVPRPAQLAGAPLSTIPFGAFGPGVYATVAAYTGARVTVRVALLPVG